MNELFDAAFVGIDNKMKTSENGNLIMNVKCNQKFTMNTMNDLLKNVSGVREIMNLMSETDFVNDCIQFEYEFAHKKFTITIFDKEKFVEFMFNH